MTSKFARRATLATGYPSAEGSSGRPRRDRVGWLERLLVKVQAPFYLRARTSPRAHLWVLAYQALTLPLSLWRRVHHFRASLEGADLWVVCVGRRKRFRDLLDGLFGPAEPSEDRAGSFEPGLDRMTGRRPRWAWRPRRLTRLGASLVVVDAHPWLVPAYRSRGWLIVPENVRWQGDLSALPPPKPPETLRSDMRKVERRGYRLEEGRGAADWAEFIDAMALPHARARYGKRAWFPGRAALEHYRAAGRLLFVRGEEVRAAGAAVIPTPSDLWLSLVGTRDGDERWAREGALSAVYFLTLDWARAQGYRRMDAGTTQPFPNDGVARYKAKLGFRPVPNPLSFTNALYVDPDCPSLVARLRAQPLFCLTAAGIEVVSADGPPDPERRSQDPERRSQDPGT